MAELSLAALLPHASVALLRLLEPSRGLPPPPIRSEILGPERFAQHGVALGAMHHAATAGTAAPTFFPRLRDDIAVLREARHFIALQAATGYETSPASEWLLDNFHLIEAQLEQIREGLPRSYFRSLPVLRDAPLAGLPRVYGIAWAWVAHTDGGFDARLLVQFLRAYQEGQPLQLKELWALPTTLRVVLIENLRRLSERLAAQKAAVEAANQCWDRIADYDIARLDALHALLTLRGMGTAFLTQLAQRALGPATHDSPTTDPAGTPAQDASAGQRAWLHAALPDLAAHRAQQPADQAADNLSVSNAVTSLRAIGDADWPDIIASTSTLMQTLLASELFVAEHPTTRDLTLHGVEALARASHRGESDVAQALLARMHSAGPCEDDDELEEKGGAESVAARCGAAYWLRGPGRPALLDDLNSPAAPRGWRARARIAWGARRFAHVAAFPVYLSLIAVGTLALVLALANGTGGAPAIVLLTSLLALLPASEAVVAVLNRVLGESLRPAQLPRLALADGIPSSHRVLVVIPCMLSSTAGIADMLHRLELHALANPEPNAQFALLTDWSDAASAHIASDDGLLRAAIAGMRALALRHPGDIDPGTPRFILLHRNRRFSTSEQQWIGWERKRGKLEQLISAIARGDGAAFIELGPTSRLAHGLRHVLTLDSDTWLPPARLREIVGVAAHPDNQPRLDATRRRVTRGYGILQPRIVPPLPRHADITPYHWLFAGQGGSDPYGVPSSEVYQDLFGEGSFTGKGLLNVAAMHAVLTGRLPDDTVLSHDLLEGALARCATLSDITLIEDSPAHADVAAARLHRWTRGDWQLLPFLARRRWPLGGINRWKMFDNLRRSIVPPAALLLLLCALAGMGPGLPAALLLVVAAFVAGPAMGAIAGFAPSRDDIARLHFYRQAMLGLLRALGTGLWQLAMLLQHSLQAVDAVCRALWRMGVSRRNLLQWTTAAAVKAAARTNLRAVLRQHVSDPALATLLLVALFAADTPHPVPVLLLCTLWGAAPLCIWWASKPRRTVAEALLSLKDRTAIEQLARDTWRLFERTVGPADLHLPPDNLQTAPHDILAHRTSPTNIGLYLLSLACARQFGWTGTHELLERMDATLATLTHLQRHRGHFLNWYDTQTGAALLPMYVSSVDSGNLCGHLLAVAQACRALAESPLERGAARAAIAASQRRLATLRPNASLLAPGAATITPPHVALDRLLAMPNPLLECARHPSDFADLLQRAGEECALLAAAMVLVAPVAVAAVVPATFAAVTTAAMSTAGPTAASLRDGSDTSEAMLWCIGDHLATLQSAARDLAAAPTEPAEKENAAALALRLHALADAFEALAWAPDFRFLYHPQRHLLHIGFRVAEQQLDAGFFDLLASEARLTSLVAIAKGDVPVRHWSALGRPFHAVGASTALRSWSGSMFEYLMPTLILDEPDGSALHAACCAAVREQIAFADAAHVPWGISESAHAGRDHTLAYQYSPQGVPALALRRTPRDELVIAPYATALALQIAPREAWRNLQRLFALGARRRYGLIEALDYSPARLLMGEQAMTRARIAPVASAVSRPGPGPGARTSSGAGAGAGAGADRAFTPVETFMAHHQGMTIVACANVLRDGIAREWAMSNPALEAVSSLLHERPPHEVSSLRSANLGAPPQATTERGRTPGLPRELTPGSAAIAPTHLLSNGRYNLMLRDNGAGCSRWGALDLTRRRDDALRDDCGSFLFVRWSPGDALASITQRPAADPRATYRCVFHADRVCFDAAWPLARAHTTVWVSPEDDVEFRQVEFTNTGEVALQVELVSTFEPTLAHAAADEAHPAFSNLFLRASWRPSQQALLFERRPRLHGEQATHVAHFLAATDGQEHDIRIQPDRARWRGRNRDVRHPLAMLEHPPHPDDGPTSASSHDDLALDTGLDPMCVLAVRVLVPAGGTCMLTLATAAAADTPTLRAVIDKYRQTSHVQRASLMSATLAGIRLRTLQVGAESFSAIQTLTTALVSTLGWPVPRLPEPAGPCDPRALWRFGISGDRPIILVYAGVPHGLGLLRTLAQALRLWSWGGVGCDLVVLNAEPASYLMRNAREIGEMRERHADETAGQATPASTGFHLLADDTLSALERGTLHWLACIGFNADGRPLGHHVNEWAAQHQSSFGLRARRSVTGLTGKRPPAELAAAAGGAFEPEGGSYSFDVHTGLRPMRPWVNVLANPAFGTILSESGGGFTWAGNSRLMRLTALSNDPVADAAAEWFVLQDLRTHAVWNLQPGTIANTETRYRITHGQGFTRITHRFGDIEVELTCCVDATLAVKQVRLLIANRGGSTSHLRLAGVVEWLLGSQRSDRATTSTSGGPFHAGAEGEQEGRTGAASTQAATHALSATALFCTQHACNGGFGDSTAFFALLEPAQRRWRDGSEGTDWTCDRRECHDASGGLVLPHVFSGRGGAGLDPCAAIATRFSVPAGESVERVFLLGHAGDARSAHALLAECMTTAAAARLDAARAQWDRLLGAISVKTPDPLFDVLVNRWLLYQAVSSRLWARAGFYQAGGAFGFRDQLQDALALAWTAPAMLRQQITLAASRQFSDGDVQHWWHPQDGAGVRTHFSDDLLWLPYACMHYVLVTGDEGLLDQSVPFLEGMAVPDGAEDAYFVPDISTRHASVYEHAARAIDHGLGVGSHGLPLMGGGDWNDGMNRVGIEGRGESVWLGFFLHALVRDFAPLADARGDAARAARWRAAATGWQHALTTQAWDGAWFRRAFFDDGSALGSANNAEARIDLIAQAWSVLSDSVPEHMQRAALDAMERGLVDDEAGLIRLLDPPFAHSDPSPGYIQAYPPGVRENGGQYNHGAVWALMARAAAQRGRRLPEPDATARARAEAQDAQAGDTVHRWFTYLSPSHRSNHPVHGLRYGTEPYAVAGDIHGAAPHEGRGGWSWYTGAAAWLHRAAVESMFGLEVRADVLSFWPCLPTHWPQAELTLRRDDRVLRFVFVRTDAVSALTRFAGQQPTLLLPGEQLHWTACSREALFVIPLASRTPTVDGTRHGRNEHGLASASSDG